jgi:hypothetical protein
MAEKKNNDFILISSDIGKNLEESEYSLRIIKIIIELPPPELPEKYWEFGNVFSEEEANQLTNYSLMHYIINTGDTISPHKSIYKLSETELKILKKYLNENLKKKYIQHSINPAEAFILFILKKDGNLRLYVDYKDLNKITIKNRHPLPLMEETLNRLNGAAIYTKLDLKETYYKIRIKKGDEWKTAFKIRYGHFEYKMMPFGLANTPATFQAYINKALAGLIDINCVAYLNNILIYSINRAEHQQHIRQILELLRQYKLYIKLFKCEFSIISITFLEFVISTKEIEIDESKVEIITK